MIVGVKRPAANKVLTAKLRRARVINRYSPLGIASGESTTATSPVAGGGIHYLLNSTETEKVPNLWPKFGHLSREVITRVGGCQTILTRQKWPPRVISAFR